MKLELFDEFDKYDFQYGSAIYRLLDNNPNVMDMIFPLINLIHQKIEVEIKLYIAEPHMRDKTFKELKIDNTHKLNELLNREEFKKYYENIEICEKNFEDYKKSVRYFYEILGDDCFLNSRYPIQKIQNNITLKKQVDVEELYTKWTEYCIASGKLKFMYMAYGASNTILYWKKEKKIQDELIENKWIEKIVEDAFKGLESMDLKEDKSYVVLLLKEFVKRDKFFDINYVC